MATNLQIMPYPSKPTGEPKRLHLRPLAPYEDRLLTALAFFRTGRKPATQAHHCLSMYLRSSKARVMDEVSFYAQRCGYSPEDFLELIYTDPDTAEQAIANMGSGLISPVAGDEPDPHDINEADSDD